VEIWVYNQFKDERKTLKVSDHAVTFGRDDSCDIVLPSQFVSRKHGRIFFEGGSYFLEITGRGGAVVANKEVHSSEKVKIEFGDEIRIGEFSVYMMQPAARRVSSQAVADSPRKRVIDLEQAMHAELLEQLNLRVTGQSGVSDPKVVALIKRQLQTIIDNHFAEIDDEMRQYVVQEYLWRSVITELARRATGKLMYSYGFEDTDLIESNHEEIVSRMISDIISWFPLKLKPSYVKEDIATIEADWAHQLKKVAPRITQELQAYITHRMISKEIEDVVLGYGPLQDLLEMPNVNEIMVVGKDHIYIEKDGSLQNTGRSFFSNSTVESIIERIITPVGRRIDRSTPLVDARLPDGSRVNAVINPLSLSGPALTIRKFAQIPFTMDDLVERKTLTLPVASFLQACVLGRKNILISGGTGSGKTTTLNVLSSFIPQNERIITIEDSAELQLKQEHLVRLETKPANIEGKGAYSIRDLVRNALRMRPDRLIVGEVRGAEALDMLQAMNTGHDGSLSTIHANTPDDTLLRLETMVLMAVDMPIRAIREQIAAALDLIVQITRLADGSRRVTHVSEVFGTEEETGRILTEDIFAVRSTDIDARGFGNLKHTGYIPHFAEELLRREFLSLEVFTG